MPDRLKLAIGVPCYGARLAMWQAEYYLTLGTALADSRERFQLSMFSLVDVCGVDVARNRLLDEAIEINADWLLMVDSDTFHQDGFDVLAVISEADRAGAAVVAFPVPRRDPTDPHLTLYRNTEAGRVALTAEDLQQPGLIPIDSAGAAFMAINVPFARRLPRPWFRFQYIEGTTRFKSEDLGFCDAIREHQGKIVTSGRFIAKHLHRPSF